SIREESLDVFVGNRQRRPLVDHGYGIVLRGETSHGLVMHLEKPARLVGLHRSDRDGHRVAILDRRPSIMHDRARLQDGAEAADTAPGGSMKHLVPALVTASTFAAALVGHAQSAAEVKARMDAMNAGPARQAFIQTLEGKQVVLKE